MELASILLARAMAWVEPIDLNPRGAVFYPDLTKALVARYNFEKFPQRLEDFDESKGVTFGVGRLGNSVIEQLVIYTYGIVVDTRTSTQESKRLLEEAFIWGSKELGLTYKPSMVKRWQYASQVTFRSTVPMANACPAVQRLADGVSKAVAEAMGESLKYDLAILAVDYDQLARKHPLGRFSIQRRDNTPFSENKYYSDAPLPTDLHIRLLEQFEADMASKPETTGERKPHFPSSQAPR
jgi:hypothetical protein